MATHRKDTDPGHAPGGGGQTSSPPATSGIGQNSASGIIEAPQKARRGKLDPHDFADGGGGGGAEAFSRRKTKK